MHREICSSEHGLCSGGITSYEFATMKIPFRIICQAKHQLKTAQEWQKKRIAQNLGLPNKDLDKKIENYLNSILEGKISYHKNPIMLDGRGVQRVSTEILKLKR